jgi:hypothetical protein
MPKQISSNKYRIHVAYHLQRKRRKGKIVNQSADKFSSSHPLKPIKKHTQVEQMSIKPTNIHSSSGGIIILHRKNSLPALI